MSVSVKSKKRLLSLFLCLSIVVSLLFTVGMANVSAESNPVAANGQLKVVGNQLCNQNGQPYQLRGMSSHGLQWYPGLINADCFKWLRDDWNSNVIRLAMYTAEKGYLTNSSVKEVVKRGVEAAKSVGMYVIIDWHILSDNDPLMNKQQAIDFYKEMSSLYKDYPNVLYEICNEPNKVNWSGSIKPYANEVIPAIRANDPDGIIIVGTGSWSQDIQDPASDPLPYNNIMYTCHFYAGTHGQWLKDRITAARNKGIAIFVTEWGTSTSSGDGGPFISESTAWLDFLDSQKVSWCNWSLSSKAETSAALAAGASNNGGWNDGNLSASGKFVRTRLKSYPQDNTNPVPTVTPTPTSTQTPPRPTVTPTPTITPTRTPIITPTYSPAPTQGGEYDFEVTPSFSATRLNPNQMFTAKVTATNISSSYYSGTKDVLLVVGLYDRNNTMVNVSYISKGIPYRGSEALSAGFKLPSDVSGYSVRAFMWDGTDMRDTNMIPLSNVAQIP